VVVTVAINMVGGSPRDQQVPDVAGQGELDATAALQNRGFKTHIQRNPDSKVAPGKGDQHRSRGEQRGCGGR